MLVALALGAVFGAGEAWAPVPPRDCGMLKEGGDRFNIRADQIRCRVARGYAGRYLSRHERPRGFSCREYGRQTAIEFRCAKGVRIFFAIRR